MSFQVIDKVIQSNVVGGTDKLVLLILASHADDDGNNIYPSTSTLAFECGTTRDFVYDHINNLMAKDILIDTGKEHSWGRGHYTCIYQIDLTKLTTVCDDVKAEIIARKQGKSTVSKPSTVSNPPNSSVDSDLSTVSILRTQLSPIIQSSSESLRSSEEPVQETSRDETSTAPVANATSTAIAGILESSGSEKLSHYANAFLLSWQSLSGNQVQDYESSLSLSKQILVTLTDIDPSRPDVWEPVLSLGFVVEALRLWDWNQNHKRGDRKFRFLTGLLAALKSDAEFSLRAQYQRCQSNPKGCPTCKKLYRASTKLSEVEHDLRDWAEYGEPSPVPQTPSRKDDLPHVTGFAVDDLSDVKGFRVEEEELDFKKPLPKVNGSGSVLGSMKSVA